MKNLILGLVTMIAAFAAFAERLSSDPRLVPDYNRDGRIDPLDYERESAGEPFTIWLNDDDDAEGTGGGESAGDTNTDLHDVPGGEGNDRDCEDEQVNGRCDLLDFFPVLVDVGRYAQDQSITWKIRSASVKAVFTELRAEAAGNFHTTAMNAFGGDDPLYNAPVMRLDEDGVEIPPGFLWDGRGVFIVEGAALADGGITLRGEQEGGDPIEVTLDLRVKNVEDMYGWMNLRPKEGESKSEVEQWNVENSTVQPSTSNLQPDHRHFILVHGYNTNHEEARGNAAEFYKKLWQSGSDAMLTAVEWRGDQSQMRFELLGVTFSPNYHVNVENAFAAARPFADACKKLPGDKILVGHSLGNMLVSSAIKDYGLDYTKFVMLNAAVAREAYDASAYDPDMVSVLWTDEDEEGGDSLTNHLDRASRWYRNFKDKKYDPYEYRRKLAWRGRFANLPRTVNYYSPTDNILKNPANPDLDDFNEEDARDARQVQPLLAKTMKFGGFWSLSEKLKGRPTLIDTINGVLTNVFGMAESDAYKCEGGWGENPNYVEGSGFDPANTHFTPFLDERMKTKGMLDILPAETERLRAQHLADAIPAESFAAGANPVATLENVNEESFIGANLEWPLFEGEEEHTNLWNHSAFREVAFYHTSAFYASLAGTGKPRIIIDTDLGSSMDDLFAVDLAARMHQAGKLDLMAVMMDRPDGHDPTGKGEFLTFADRYLASLGFGDLPIGKALSPIGMDTPQYVFNPYWTLIYSNNVTGVGLLLPTNRTPEQVSSLTSAVTLYRRLLHDLPDGQKVVICSTGFLSNLRALMDSGEDYEGDGIYFTGLELIAAKVKELRIMGGCFDPESAPDGKAGAEYNFAGDPSAAKKVVEGWPTPVVLSPWEVGLQLDYKPEDVLKDFPAGTFDPVVRAAYTYWSNPLGEDDMNRLWDPMTVLPLSEGETLVPLSAMGGVLVDETTGKTTFTPNASSNRCYQVASNMNATAVMNRLRAIYRTGNPSLPDAVRCIKDAGVDYNGHDLAFKVPKFSLGAYGPSDVHPVFGIEDRVYEPDEVTYDPVLEVFSVHFTVPEGDAVAGQVYNGALTITLENRELGPNVVKVVQTQIVQGAIDRGDPEFWFYEPDLVAPTNYVPETEMPEKVTARVKTTVSFSGEPFEERYLSEDGPVQAAVRIVDDGMGGYKFQFYAFTADADGRLHEDWWDCNVSNVVPVAGHDYEITAELMYLLDAQRQLYTVSFSAKDSSDNRPAAPVFLGNMIDDTGDIGNAGRLGSVAFTEKGEDLVLDGVFLVDKVNANLARIDGDAEYEMVSNAVDVAEGRPIRLLYKASWKPTAADLGKPVKFLNKSWLHLDLSDLPTDTRAVWTDVDGNNGTLTLVAVGDAVAMIVGSKTYATLEEAFAEVREGETICLLKDYTLTIVEIDVQRSCTLDLQGYKLSHRANPGDDLFYVWSEDDDPSARFTVRFCNGTISTVKNKGIYAEGNCDVILENLAICVADDPAVPTVDGHGIVAPIVGTYGTKVTIENCAFTNLTDKGYVFYGYNSGCDLIIKSGDFYGKEFYFDFGESVIQGGQFTGATNLFAITLGMSATNCLLTIDGGVFKSDVAMMIAMPPASAVISNGVFEGAATFVDRQAQGAEPTSIVGGRFRSEPTGYFTIPEGMEFKLVDGYYELRPIPPDIDIEPGKPIICDTAEEATNVLMRARFAPSEEVAEKLGEGSPALQAYCDMFALDVVPASDSKWAVAAFLLPPAWTNVVESAQAATRQIPVRDIAAWQSGDAPIFVQLTNCVPGFYYSLYDGAEVTNLKADIRDENCNVLCGAEKTVDLPEVSPPPGCTTSGFFTIGVLEAPSVIPGETETSTSWSALPRTKEKHDIL